MSTPLFSISPISNNHRPMSLPEPGHIYLTGKAWLEHRHQMCYDMCVLL